MAQVLQRRRNHQAFRVRRIDADQHPHRIHPDQLGMLGVADPSRVGWGDLGHDVDFALGGAYQVKGFGRRQVVAEDDLLQARSAATNPTSPGVRPVPARVGGRSRLPSGTNAARSRSASGTYPVLPAFEPCPEVVPPGGSRSFSNES